MSILRKISNHELSLHRFGNVIAVVRLSGNADVSAMQKAITLEAQRHPLLSARVKEQAGNYYFEAHQKKFAINMVKGANEHDVLEGIIRHRFDIYTQLAFATIAVEKAKCDVYLCCSHMICDARSLIALLNNALKNYENILNHNHIDNTPLTLMPPIELIAEQQFGVLTPINLRQRHLLLKNADLLAGIPKQVDCQTQIKTLSINLSKLQKTAHKHNLTLNSLLSAAQLLALYTLLSKTTADLTLAMAIDIRQHLARPVSPEHLFAAVDAGVFRYSINESLNAISLAQKIHKDTKHYIESQDMLRALYVFDLQKAADLLPKPNTSSPLSADNTVPISISSSNVGVANVVKKTNNLIVDAVNFFTTCTDGDIIANAVSFNNTLTLTLCYPSPCYTAEQINAFLSQIRIKLENFMSI